MSSEITPARLAQNSYGSRIGIRLGCCWTIERVDVAVIVKRPPAPRTSALSCAV